jgi:hypothetical protein
MQTASLFARGRELGVALAAVLIVSEDLAGNVLADDAAEEIAKEAGKAAAASI